jgi:hypothetical protein
MSQQFYKRPNIQRDNDEHGVYDDKANFSGSKHGQEISSQAGDTSDIDKLLAEAEQNPESFYGSEPAGDTSTAAASPKELSKAEASGNHTEPTTAANKPSVGKRTRAFFGSRKGKATIIGGGIAGLGVGGSLMFFSMFSGPLEFVHIAQYLQGAHFSRQENASDSRLGSLYRWMKQGNTVGETRLTWLESKYKDRMLKQLKTAGLEPKFNARTGYYEGFFVDKTSETSPYRGMSNDEVKVALSEKYGVPSYQIRDGKFYVPERSFFAQRRSLVGLSHELGYSKVTSAVRARVLSKYGLVTWHPMKILDKRANESVAKLYEKWKKAREERLRNGEKVTTVKASGAQQEDENGNKTSLNGQDETLTKGKATEILDSVKNSKGVKITGGVAAALGIACTVRTVSDNLGVIRYETVIAPLIREGMDAVTVGNQIQLPHDGDVSTLEMGFIQKSFTREDKNGKILDSWDQAASIQANTGGSGGKPMDKGTIDMINNVKPSWIAWADNAAIGTLCSTAGQVVAGGVSVVIGVVSGGVVSTIVGALVSAIATPTIIDHISSLVAGDAANIAAEGAAWGSNIDYGAKMGANLAALQMGGTSLTNQQLAVLDSQVEEQNQIDESQKSVFARMFDPMDTGSLTARAAHTYATSTLPSTMANMLGSVANLPKVFSSALGGLFSGNKAEAIGSTYDYGFATYGFSATDLSNSTVQNPYDNAEAVAPMLDSNGQNGTPDYIGKAKECFGVTIAKDSEGRWGALPTDDMRGLYDGTYDQKGCIDSKDPNWLKVRFFIFDTGVAEGFSCVTGVDEQSCTNSGFGAPAAAADATPTSTGTLPTGSAQDLAKQLIPYINSKKISCNGGQASTCPDITKTAAGQSIRTGSCYVNSLDPQLLSILVYLAQKGHTFVLSAICTDHPSNPKSLHHSGKAADFNYIDGVFIGPGDSFWDSQKTAAAKSLDQDIAQIAPKSTGFGQQQCHVPFDFLSGFSQFTDTCNHQHVQVN